MSLDPRNFFLNDTDDAQLPPLLPPISSGALLRPPPLEPSAQTDDDNLHNVKFTNLEPKSLNQAIPPTKEAPNLPAYIDPADLRSRSRKWPKLDFYQLPKPSTSSFSSSAPGTTSLPLIPVLNDLHQPPPSAARFPPIIENEGSEQSQDTLPPRQDTSETTHTLDKNVDGISVGTNWRKQRRIQSRGRVQWTEPEIADLLEGVRKYGLGRWKNILKDEDFHFNSRRTAIDLKDRYRTCCMAQDRAKKELVDTNKLTTKSAQQEVPSVQGQVAPLPRSKKNLPHELKGASSRKSLPDESVGSLKLEFENYSIQDIKARIGAMTSPFDENNLAPFARWPPVDDAKLERGFRKHGFKWSLIASDPDIGLKHRTSAQIRDRFRIKFAQNYRDNNPVLTGSALNMDNDNQETDGKASDNAPKARGTRNSGWQDLDELADDHAFTLPPLSKELWKTTQPQDTAGPSGSTARAKPPASAYTNDATNWLSLSNQEIGLDYEDARGINVDSLDDDLDFGSQLAPLRYPYDQDWTEEGFDSSLQLPPMILFPPETDDAQ